MMHFSRRDFIQNTALGTLAAAIPVRSITADAQEKRPNIIFIMVDDMGYHDLGCYGSKTIQTPEIDKMCSEGVKFTDCYSGASVCAPARSTLMTGYHIGHTPVRGNNGGTPLFPEDITVAEVLKKADYVTGGFGKWGLGNHGKQGAAEKQGFDLFFGYYNQWHAHDYYTSHLFRNSERVELNGFSHYVIYDETVKFIKESAKSGKPFFCYCPWTPPHDKYEIPEDDPAWALYKDKPWHDNPEIVAKLEAMPDVQVKKAKIVAAFDTMIDRQVGEILKLLKELGIDDNTIVFFTSDNGAARRWPGIHESCGELKGRKGSKFEGGIRVPMVVRWPGMIKAGSESGLPWYFPDVMPTLAELAGVSKKVPKHTDGISVVPTLLGKGRQKKHEYLFWKDAIRMGKWKGLGKPGNLSLYDLSKDIGEENNLAEKHPEIAAKLSRFMEEAWTEPRSQKSDGKYTGREEEP